MKDSLAQQYVTIAELARASNRAPGRVYNVAIGLYGKEVQTIGTTTVVPRARMRHLLEELAATPPRGRAKATTPTT